MAEKKEITNPFETEISYMDLLAEIPEGKSVEDHFKGVLDENQINILNSEIKYYKQSLVKPNKEEKQAKTK